MNGIQYVVDDEGRRRAVILDLEQYGELWEDFQDTILVESRENEPRMTLDEVRSALHPPEPDA